MTRLRMIALGDSITLGIGDPLPDGRWRGWAALLAEAIDADLINLAVSGAVSTDVVARQLPHATGRGADLASVVVGVNDTLRRGFDPAAIALAIDHTVWSLRATGAQVLTVRLPDPGRMLRLPQVLARPLTRRIRAVNAVIDAVAARHGALCFDAAGHPDTYLPQMWGIDRLHPSERGHRLLAGGCFDVLAAAGVATGRRPASEPSSPEPTRSEQAVWMATRGARWLAVRSTDLLPDLLATAATEWRAGRGGAALLDRQADAGTARALGELATCPTTINHDAPRAVATTPPDTERSMVA